MIGLIAAMDTSTTKAAELAKMLTFEPNSLAASGDFLNTLAEIGVIWSGIFFAAGLACLLQGYKIYRWVVVIAALTLGLILGYQLGQHIRAEVIVGASIGLLLAVLSMPMMKYAVGMLAAMVGALLGANAWTAIIPNVVSSADAAQLGQQYWAGALIGAIMFGMTIFLLFELSVVLFTSVSGGLLVSIGVIALLLQVPSWKMPVTESLGQHPAIVPLVVFVPAVVGLVTQQHFGALKKKKSSKPAS